ncbi:MAG: Rne/Rng family ribonuclease [Candidatus Delongbacteria bacterium]|nr:Rne/Rng family ribonuclease [Candidatus Delongbacteria bacterium]MDY0016365.1 Rne/Rng family ribonuclease [Candidatus Delongbacteria bacterium]
MRDNLKEIFINVSTNETRVAIVEEERLVEMFIERPDSERKIGNIYAGYIDNVVPGMNSVFINMGEEQNGFSHLDEFRRDLMPKKVLSGKYIFKSMDEDIVPAEKEKEDRRLEKGNKVMVQAIKEPIGSKGPRVTSDITIPGRYIVLIPNDHGVKISKKITNHSERRRLNKLVKNLIPEDFGVIVRTAAENKESSSFTNDIISTFNIWKKIVKDYKKTDKAKLLYKDYDLAASIVRDVFTEDVSRMVIDSKELYDEIREYVKNNAPELEKNIILHDGGEPVFDKYYHINKDYYISLSREVYLKTGGSIVIDHTEALVAIDVNSRRFIRNKSQEENILNLNLTAAKEIARQLRLRDLGGLIVIDFVDMADQAHRDRLLNEFQNFLKADKAKISIEKISRFGLVEMTRQRLKPSLTQTIYEECPACAGKGIVKSKETIAVQLDRWLKNYKFNTQSSVVDISINEELYNFLNKTEKRLLHEMLIKNWVKINFTVNNTLSLSDFRCFVPGTKEDITKQYMN